MARIYRKMILAETSPKSPLRGLNRVLDLDVDSDLLLYIEIPLTPRRRPGAPKANYYVRGIRTESYAAVVRWLDGGRLAERTEPLPVPPLWAMSDDQIRRRYPPRKGQIESAPLRERDRKAAMLQPLMEALEAVPALSLLDLDTEAIRLAEAAGVSSGQMLDAVHRWLAFDNGKTALLPNRFRSGNPGTERYGKRARLGRKNAAASAGNASLTGYISSEQDRLNLQDGWAMFVRPGTTVETAFLATAGVFYTDEYSIKNGLAVPELLLASQRPTIREFRNHGPRGVKGGEAARRLIGEGQWARDYAPLCSSATAGIVAGGLVGSLDASPIDVNLTACFDPTVPIGVARALFVRDVYPGLYYGFQDALGGLSTEDANLAILRAATDKEETLRRYDLSQIPPESFPRMFFSRYLSDNGELRSIKGVDEVVKKLGSRIEFIASGRADRNSPSEAAHHSRHRGLDHHLEGTNHGRPKRRGEPMAITKALLSRYNYIRLLWMWMHWKNALERVPELLTTEMRRDRVKATRIEILRWMERKGYIAGKPMDPLFLRAHLLPAFTASIQRGGLFLHRPDNGKVVELLPRARFYSKYLETSGLLLKRHTAPGRNHISVRVDPEDLSSVLLIDEFGIHVIPNTSTDHVLLREGSVADLCAMNQVDRINHVETATERDQNKSDQLNFRLQTEDHRRRQKAAAAGAKDKHAKKVDRSRSSIRANQAAEQRAALDTAAARGAGVLPGTDAKVAPNTSASITQAASRQHSTPATGSGLSGISKIFEEQLSKLHRTREDTQ